MSTLKRFLDLYRDPEYFHDVRRIALPIIIQQLMFSGLNMLGIVLVGQKGDASVAAVGLGIVGGILTGVILQLVKGPILSLYNVSREVIRNAGYLINIVSLFLWMRVNNMTTVVGILRAGGDTRFSLFLDGIIIWLVGVPMAYIGATVLGLPVYLVYLCAMAEEAAKWVLGINRYFSRKWINNLAAQVEDV